jgi:RNA polymerase sigma-70 factor (ECF subfamily)
MNGDYGAGAGSNPDAPTSTSTSLLDRVKARDAEAWQRLVALYGPTVFLWCRKAGLTIHDAADVVQEIFAAVVQGVADLRRERPGDSFRAWLKKIAQNKICDHYRQTQRQPRASGGTTAQERLRQIAEPQLASSLSEPFCQQSEGLELRTLQLIRGEFEERTWRAFWRMAVDARRAAEVADELGMTKKAVRQAKYRVLSRLRQELDGLL